MNKIILLLVSMIALSACSGQSVREPSAAETAAAAQSVNVLNNAPVSYSPNYKVSKRAISIQALTGSDLISPQDTLSINVFKVPDLSAKSLTVESSGLISLPLIGSVKVSGLTIAQAEKSITSRLGKYMQDPKVSITRTDKAVSKRVTVEGEVKTPGVYPIKGNLSFLQAIAMAQGLSNLADSRNVLFYRDGMKHRINLDLVRKGQIADPVLRGDDRIVVIKDPKKVKEKKILDYIPAVTAPLSLIPALIGG